MIARRIRCLFAIAALVLISGCFLEERMFWSPDGRRAAVIVPQGLCLMDTNGNLSAPLISDVTYAAWLPDGQGLVILRHIAATNWQEIGRLISPQEKVMLEGFAAGLPGLITGALEASGGDMSTIEEKFFKPLKIELGPAFLAAIICLRDTKPETFSNLLARVSNPEQLELSKADEAIVQELSVVRLDGDKLAGQPLVLERTLAALSEPRPSPSTAVVAFLRDNVLTVAPLGGGTNRVTVNDKIGGSYDWTPDGKALVYAAGLSEEWKNGDMNIANVQRRVVIGGAGELVEGESVLLAAGAFPFNARVRCLPDGRVLFASLAIQLPAGANAASEARFYVVDPAAGTNAAPIAIPTAPKALPADLSGFAVSPDGRYVVIGEYGSDSIALLEIATGRLEVISPNRGARNRTMPAWRSDELYFAALPEAGAKRPEWMRWRKGGTAQVFSGRWPNSAVENLVEIQK